MVHLFNYVIGTKDLPLIISAYKSGMIKWYIDGSYVVRPNMRVHTGRGLTMGRGFPISALSKHNINTTSSIESEIIGVDQLMSLVLWIRLFLEYQGYEVADNIIYQDNKSTILL